MQIRRWGYVLALLVLLSQIGWRVCRADEWGPNPTEYWSDSHRFVLHVDGDMFSRPYLSLKAKSAHGFELLWKITSPQERPPVAVFIAEDRRDVVLLDEWGRLGYGKVLTFLGHRGNVLASYKLNQILTEEEILHAGHSISSIHWDSGGQFFFRQNQTQFAFILQSGKIGLFDLATGQMLPVPPNLQAAIRQERIPVVRAGLTSVDADTRSDAIEHIAQLGDRASVPILIKLLDDPTNMTTTAMQYPDLPDGSYQNFYIQLMAGKALVRLLGDDAAPLLERKLATPEPHMRDGWIELTVKAGGPKSRAILSKLTNEHRKYIRQMVLGALLTSEDGLYLRNHLQLLHDSDKNVRLSAVYNLAENARKGEVPLLQSALEDSDDTCALWALRGLIRLNPPNLIEMMRQQIRLRPHSWTAKEAQQELARRGDKTELQHLVDWVRKLQYHSHNYTGWGTEEMDAEEACKILARSHAPGAEAALREAAENPCPEIQRPAFGALATCGDKSALAKVRQFAQQGEALARASAIEWLGICHDRDSIPFLKQALQDREPWVREAAQKALQQIVISPASR